MLVTDTHQPLCYNLCYKVCNLRVCRVGCNPGGFELTKTHDRVTRRLLAVSLLYHEPLFREPSPNEAVMPVARFYTATRCSSVLTSSEPLWQLGRRNDLTTRLVRSKTIRLWLIYCLGSPNTSPKSGIQQICRLATNITLHSKSAAGRAPAPPSPRREL